MPLEWDIQKDTVYHNFNVEEVEREGEETRTVYEYDVEEYTLQEYSNLQKETIEDMESAIDDLTIAILEG